MRATAVTVAGGAAALISTGGREEDTQAVQSPALSVRVPKGYGTWSLTSAITTRAVSSAAEK